MKEMVIAMIMVATVTLRQITMIRTILRNIVAGIRFMDLGIDVILVMLSFVIVAAVTSCTAIVAVMIVVITIVSAFRK